MLLVSATLKKYQSGRSVVVSPIALKLFVLALLTQLLFDGRVFVMHAQALPSGHKATPAPRKACSTVLKPLIVKIGVRNIGRRPKSSWIKQRFLIGPDRYIREMSYGTTCLDGTITRKWYELPGPMSRYWVPWQNLKVDKNNLRRLVSDTLEQVERDFKVSQFDFLIFVVGANAAQWGNQGLNTYPGVLGWKDKSQLVTRGGQTIRGGIAIYALSAPLGKVFHNIAHILAGVRNGRRVLPDMYDQVIASSSAKQAGENAEQDYRRSQIHMGAWDPMSCNSCTQRPGAPGVSAWTKIRLGWLDETRIRTPARESAEVWLQPLADKTASTLAIRVPLSPTTYYLLENRQQIGHDQNIPASGVLILFSDDKVAEPKDGRAPV